MNKHYQDQIQAEKEVEKFIRKIVKKYGLQDSTSAEVKRETFSNGLGGITGVWVNNRPIATATIVRDEFNYSLLMLTEHDWENVTLVEHHYCEDCGVSSRDKNVENAGCPIAHYNGKPKAAYLCDHCFNERNDQIPPMDEH